MRICRSSHTDVMTSEVNKLISDMDKGVCTYVPYIYTHMALSFVEMSKFVKFGALKK